jgi:HPt (histidine-containing phosphotransfer) domain-containing protein
LIETLAAATPDTEVAPIPPCKGRRLGVERVKRTVSRVSVPVEFEPALERLGGDVDLLKRQMSFFLDDAPKLIEQLKVSIDSADAQQARLAAHRLQGFVSSYDRHDAAETAQRLERCVAESRFVEASSLATMLADHVNRLSDSIRAYRESENP